jgi:hypothetical protein
LLRPFSAAKEAEEGEIGRLFGEHDRKMATIVMKQEVWVG